MISSFFFQVLYRPLYNALVYLIVKLILFPLSLQSVKTQVKMKEIQPELDALNEKYKDDRQKKALETFALYKKYNIRPFLGIVLILIQLPIVLALYRIFYAGGLPVVDPSILYSFVEFPEQVKILFLGFIDITKRNIWLAVVVAVTQYLQARLMNITPAQGASTSQFQKDLARTMQLQVRYIFPLIMFGISYSLASVVSLYLITSNIFTIGQELYIRSKYGKR
jgi:YidC/Oxa1 family membrane protein insertase